MSTSNKRSAKATPTRTILMLRPQEIVICQAVQSRIATNKEIVSQYAEAMERDNQFPPIIVFFDPKLRIYYVADGFHRLEAHLLAKPNDMIEAEMLLGTESDALWFSIAANQIHGFQRSSEDKRKAVEQALLHVNGEKMSNRQIAAYVGVSHPTVNSVRKKLETEGKLTKCNIRIGSDGRTYRLGRLNQNDLCECGNCGHYKPPRCLIEGEMRESTHPACDEFRMKATPKPEPEPEEETDAPRFHQEHIPKEVRHRVSRRRPGEYVDVPLSRTNVDHAAVEIRHYFDDAYAAALGEALVRLTRESFE